jgi:NAD(P)-dependent dehydrogenase (short-subunit alcohol dehydrogenase family)
MAERKNSETGSTRIPIPSASFREFSTALSREVLTITATHNSPRVWFLTSALSPLTVRLIRLLLAHGDYVAAGLPPAEIEDEERSSEFRELINECKSGKKDREGWNNRIRGIRCDGRVMGQCGAAVAEAVEIFGRIDILLCCASEGMDLLQVV